MLKLFTLICITLFQGIAHAEPWLSTRYAQNCAACHAPGRINLPPADRRCSLSCQGCHVNPNGGGLRSYYGKWNEDRVLRSWVSKGSMNYENFAPHKDQKYGKKPYTKLSKKQIKSKKFKKFVENKGFKIATTDKVEIIDEEHDRFANPYDRTAETDIEFLYQVPDGDPYREMYKSKFDAGVDLRWQLASGETVVTSADGKEGDPIEVDSQFFMSGDFGVRYRPVYKKYHFVYESRMLGSPSEDADLKNTLVSASTRSLYFMADDLPYNVFLMYGYYRPLFGNYSPDHTLLSQRMTAQALNAGTAYRIGPFETLSIGTAPNVPYANIHMISGSMNPNSKIEGFAINTGLRFVSYGASANYTYWSTKDEDLETEMHSVHLAGKLGPIVANYEALSLAKKTDVDFRQGGLHFLDLNFQLVREIYGVFEYTTANVSADLTPGSANQMKVGLKGFLYPGMELQVLYGTDTSEPEEGSKTDSSVLTSQLHLFM